MQQRLNGEEKQKLDHYLHAFESMSRQGALVMQERIGKAAPEVTERFGTKAYAFERMEASLKSAGAFIAGLANVATISSVPVGMRWGCPSMDPAGSWCGAYSGA